MLKIMTRMQCTKHVLFWLGALFVFILDFATKETIRQIIPVHGSVLLVPLLSFTHIQNTGAVFGLFHALNMNLLFILLSVLVIGWIVYASRTARWTHQEQLSLGLILGGVCGNLIDRIVYGAVTDFIDLGIWPVFNVADAALTTGVILLLVKELFFTKSLH